MLPLLLSLGCGLSSAIAGKTVQPKATHTPMPTFTPTPVGAAFEQVALPTNQPAQAQATIPPTAQPVPPTNTPVPPPTNTPDTTPRATITQNMNVRSGPGTGYGVAGAGEVGQTAEIIGRNADNSWVQIKYPAGGEGTGWLYVELIKVDGNLDKVGVVQVAPPPTPTPVPTDTPVPATPVPEKKYQFTPTGWHASKNAAIVHFKGRIKDEGGNLINGYSVLLDNGAFSVMSHPTGASVWYPEKGDGEWDVVMPGLFTAQGWWWLTVVRYNCNFAAAFDAQCKDFTKLSEDVKVQVKTPEESIINADWICHWDCDKGLYVNGYRRSK